MEQLTARQREILALVATGLTNDETGRRLGISSRTVQKTMERVYRRLRVPNRMQAARLWLLAGQGAPSAFVGRPSPAGTTSSGQVAGSQVTGGGAGRA